MVVSVHQRSGLNAALRTLLQCDPILLGMILFIFVIYSPTFKKKKENPKQNKNPNIMWFSQVYLQL